MHTFLDGVGNDDEKPQPDKRVVVGFNNSAAAWDALRWAADEAGRRRATLEIVTCIAADPTRRSPAAAFGVEPSRSTVDEAVRVAENRGHQIDVHASVEPGAPGDVLVKRSRDAVMLVIGRRDPSSHTSIGDSLSSHCLAYAACPVTVATSATTPDHLDTIRPLCSSNLSSSNAPERTGTKGDW